MKREFITAALLSPLLLCSGATPTWAQAAVAATRYYEVVARGHRVEIDHLGSLDPDCRSRGSTTVDLLSAPQGGQVATSVEQRFPSFVQANVRSRCDLHRSASTVIYYTARPDFTGTDTFDVEVLFPAGVARKIRYRVEVR